MPGAGDIAVGRSVVKTKPCPQGSSVLVIPTFVVVTVAQIYSHFHLACRLASHKCKQSQRSLQSVGGGDSLGACAGQRPEGRLGRPRLRLEDACRCEQGGQSCQSLQPRCVSSLGQNGWTKVPAVPPSSHRKTLSRKWHVRHQRP